MSSTILYKFRSGTTFEALPLPGSAARLLDVKKAIVQAKKLDQGGALEFDLAVRDATTNAEYTDDAMLLPRGARLVVQRLPAARGHGLLAKIARLQYGGGAAATAGASAATASTGVPSNYYTIQSHGHDDQDEFVSSATTAAAAAAAAQQQQQQEDKELAALRAATEVAHAAGTSAPAISGRGGGGGYRPPPGAQRGAAQGYPHHHQQQQQQQAFPRQRPNADPELRDQDKQPRKKATGIPRTFLSLSKPSEGADEDAAPLLQPNQIGFEELVQRRGGLSESAAGSKRDLDYALKLTATTIPEYLQCAICEGVVRDAMILPWDPEGRTTCEPCIRDALTQNGFRCPLTGQEASPDDLLPNHALRKAAEQFVKKVMEQMDEIEKQQVEDDKPALEMTEDGTTAKPNSAALLDGDSADKGVILSKRASIAEKRKKQFEEDPFGGDDDFGGDVFAVETEKPVEEAEEETKKATEEKPVGTEKEKDTEETPAEGNSLKENDTKRNGSADDAKIAKEKDDAKQNDSLNVNPVPPAQPPQVEITNAPSPPTENPNNLKSPSDRRERQRQLPAGYTMGPAGGAVGGPREGSQSYSPRGDGGGRGGGRFGGGRYHDRTARHEAASPHTRREVVSRTSCCVVLLKPFFSKLFECVCLERNLCVHAL